MTWRVSAWVGAYVALWGAFSAYTVSVVAR
jgi:hypothetical protein